MIQSPCNKCPEKGCGLKHDTCEPYQEWSTERQAELKAHKMDSESYAFKVDRIKQFKSKKWGGGDKK